MKPTETEGAPLRDDAEGVDAAKGRCDIIVSGEVVESYDCVTRNFCRNQANLHAGTFTWDEGC